MANKRLRNDRPLVDKILNSGTAGIAGVALTYPFDLAKTRLQYQSSCSKQYANTWDCWRQVRAREGWRALYRGCLISVLLIGPDRFVKLCSNEALKSSFKKSDKTGLPRPKRLLVYTAATACQSLITCPMELLKIQMQMYGIPRSDTFKPERASVVAYAKQIIQTKGFKGFYRGLDATLLRDLTFTTFYLPWFYVIKSMGPVDRCTGRTEFWWSSVSAFSSAGIAVIASNPFDIFKTRLQVLFPPDAVERYQTLRGVVWNTYNTEGLGGCFSKGLAPRLVVIGTLFALAQCVYQAAPSVQEITSNI